MKKLTPIKAIRAKCLDCCNGQMVEVRLCTITRCPLYDYRMGHRPKGNTETDNLPSNDESEENPHVDSEFLSQGENYEKS